ncbi:MAG TPA: HEAT repeat domain-containing protein [Planctomycetota bacterium]|nr:HEAT repeat domain-containing protein [Planctomycetota bacterium]
MKTQDKIAEAVDQVPALDKRGTFTGPSWDELLPALDTILAAGKDGVVAVVAMLKDVDDGADYKARYILHVLAQYLGRPGKEAPRAIFVEALASQLGGERSKGVQGYVARQLQVIGTKDGAAALGKLLPDPELCEYAAQALLAIRAGAVEVFRSALPELKGGPRLTVLQALGVLADAASSEAMKGALADSDRDVRLAGAWGLARVGDAASVEAVLKAADVEAGYERIKATSSALLLAENLLAAGKKPEAAKIYKHLKATRSDPSEAYVADIASERLTSLER